MTVVSDTSPITNLAGIRQLDLLHQLYGTITIPKAVYDEMANVGRTVPGALEVQTLPWIQTRFVTDLNQVAALRAFLNRGEAEAIALALELNPELLLIDEKPGRTVALQYGIKITGILGVLLEAKRIGLIIVVKPLIDQLIQQMEFWMSNQLYKVVLQSAGESE